MSMRREDGRPGEFFSWSEMQGTRTGIDNVAPEEARENLRRLCYEILDPVRRIVGPIRVNSGYRSLAVNTKVGGSRTSAHMKGCAADIVPMASDWTPDRLAQLIAAGDYPFDQLILYESGFVHVGQSRTPRRQLLYSPRSGGYQRGLSGFLPPIV